MNKLIYLSKNDIPFKEAQVNIHQPTIDEISLISEESFHIGCQFLNFSLDMIPEKDKFYLENKTDFEIFMSIMNSKESLKYCNDALLVLTLLFPEYEIKLTEVEILLLGGPAGCGRINKFNFNVFKEILVNMFQLNFSGDGSNAYNPADARAAKIAEKFNKRKKILAERKGEKIEDIDILERYVSILTVGEQKDRNSLMQLTVSQLKDEFARYQLKYQNDIYLRAKMAGAQDLEEIEDWMKPI